MDDARLQLPDDPQALKRLIAERDGIISQERAAHAAEIQTLREDNALLQHRLKLLLRSSYGPRAERFDPRQLLLFGLRVPPIDPAGPAGASGQPPDAATESASGKQRKPHGRRKLPGHLPRIRIEHDLEEADKP